MEKDNIQSLLIDIGRQMVREKGTEALTVRKLSDASGCSVGAIYNQFANMDNFTVLQNKITLAELAAYMCKEPETDDPFVDLNNILQRFVDYVCANKNLWYMLFNFHLTHGRYDYSFGYRREVQKILRCIRRVLERAVPEMERPEQLLSSQILWLSLFALSSFLTKDVIDAFSKVDKSSICQIMVNTFVVGLTVLEKRNG
ncbi:MAG: TetR/AcrR family transcriptional regulator [Alphaproteobacteria bacterium]|nr:TetR/AcrR family transcriptional regulator [Alphaproteobacteria bacterium]